MKLRVTPTRMLVRTMSLLRTDPAGVRTGLVALLIATVAGLIIGSTLGSITKTLLALPGLIVLEPAINSMCSNIFGALASRIATMSRLGEFKFSRNTATRVGQNVYATLALSIICSAFLGIAGKIMAEAFGLRHIISFQDLFVISVLGGFLLMAIAMVLTFALAILCVRRNWDLDNVGAPLISAIADVLIIPCLLLASLLVRRGAITNIIFVCLVVIGIYIFIRALFNRLELLRRIVRESISVLFLCGVISILAGLTIEGRLSSLSKFPIFLVFLAPLLSINGVIAAIFSSRISTKLHLGTINAERFRFAPVSEDVIVAYLLSTPMFIGLGLFCLAYSPIAGVKGPGWLSLLVVTFFAGIVATTLSNILGYLTALVTFRLGYDPDNFGVPVVTSSSDFIGAVVLMVAIGLMHL